MAGAYQYIGNGGIYTKPYSYTHVLDSQGNIVLEKSILPERVVSYETATIMNRLLQRVTTAQYGTGTASKFRQDIPIAGKTGTTDKDVDQWFIGVTPYYVGVCWLGYDEPETISYWNYPPPIIWKNIMSGLHEELPGADFEYSSKVVSKTYCTYTGLLASEDCETTDTGWYTANNVPRTCTYCSGDDDIDDLGLFYESEPDPGLAEGYELDEDGNVINEDGYIVTKDKDGSLVLTEPKRSRSRNRDRDEDE
jgi:penicillin-binding protein 1A